MRGVAFRGGEGRAGAMPWLGGREEEKVKMI
jgi:hypothetical protein